MTTDMTDDPASQAPTDSTPAHHHGDDPVGRYADMSREDVEAELARARSEAGKFRSQLRTLETDAQSWRAHQDAQKTELQKATERAEAAEHALADARTATLRMEVAAAKGLPAELASRLVGATREELDADADRFAALIHPAEGSSKPALVTDFWPGRRGTPMRPKAEVSADDWIRQLARGNSDSG